MLADRRSLGRGEIKQHVQTLDRHERLVLILYYAEELTPIEISLVLDLPESRVIDILDRLQVQAKHALSRQTPHPANRSRDTPGNRATLA